MQATHWPTVASQAARLVPAHLVTFVTEHWPQEPFIWQAGALAGHCTSLVHGTHVCVALGHTGVVPLHWAFEVQATHVPVVTLQAGVAPEHVVTFVEEHSPHVPLGWQAGVTPPHWLSLVHPRQV